MAKSFGISQQATPEALESFDCNKKKDLCAHSRRINNAQGEDAARRRLCYPARLRNVKSSTGIAAGLLGFFLCAVAGFFPRISK